MVKLLKALDLFNFAKDKIGFNQAKWLLEDKFKLNNFNLENLEIDNNTYESIVKLVNKIADGYPLQYVLGKWEFFGYDFKVGEGVLIPRQDTETLCEEIIKFIGNKQGLNILDLCSGSGCIAITIDKKCPNNNIYAIEKSDLAFEYLTDNIKLNNSCVKAIKSDVLDMKSFDNLPKFDIIVSNPPYLTKQDMENLQKEVTYEPEMALYGDDDGLFFYENITRLWKSKLKIDSALFFEIGINQDNDVYKILLKNNFINVCKIYDLCGIIRVIYGFVK